MTAVVLSDADQAISDVLEAVWRGDPAIVVPSPPGAGKSGLVERVAVMAMVELSERVAVACQTGAQTMDLVCRMAANYPSQRFVLFPRRGWEPTPRIMAFSNIDVIDSGKDLPDEPCVVVGTAAKWEYTSPDSPFDLLLVDEAFQLSDYVFTQVARIGERYLLVGDPGQIAPVITSDVRRWAHLLDGPQRSAPDALLHRRPADVTVVKLPATRRLGPRTAEVIQPVFYPDLPFRSIRADRVFEPGASDPSGLLAAAATNEIAGGVLAASTPGVVDAEMARTIAALARSASTGTVRSGDADVAAVGQPGVGVVCAHVAQVAAVQAALGPEFMGIQVDTAERWQGQEAEVVIVWHPLSGRPESTEFAKDAGRLCVMLSRHRAACVILWRDGAPEVLARGGTGLRTLGDPLDRSYEGWRANTKLFEMLPTVPVP